VKKSDVVSEILKDRLYVSPKNKIGEAYAPTNIALCKYWGKRNQELNLPVTSSLSISLADKGAAVSIKVNSVDQVILNNVILTPDSGFSQRLFKYIDLFRIENSIFFQINIQSNIPIAAGLASSACGFASVIKALNHLYAWELSNRELSILARLGSGSASRSIVHGFVEWHVGKRDDGMDSYSELIEKEWPELCIGLCILNRDEKKISSREAMQRTIETGSLYPAWPAKVAVDLSLLRQAITSNDFELLGRTSESNAMTMHATMLSAWPAISYCLPETLVTMQKVWKLRDEGLSLYFTQDAGPNLKLLFLKKDLHFVVEQFENVEVVNPFR